MFFVFDAELLRQSMSKTSSRSLVKGNMLTVLLADHTIKSAWLMFAKKRLTQFKLTGFQLSS